MSFNWQDKLIDQFVAGKRMGVAKYGAGKCRVSILAALKLLLSRTSGLITIAAPVRNYRTWLTELSKWLPSDQAYVELDPHSPQLAPPQRSFSNTRHILLVQHNFFKSTWKQIAYLQPDVLIFDESTVIKNPKANITQYALLLSSKLPGTFKIALTGNPAPEHPLEIWSQFQFCYGAMNPFGATYYKFLNTWFVRSDFTWTLKMDRTDEFMSIFDKHTCRMDEEDVQEHKEQVGVEERYAMYFYDASTKQQRLMKALMTEWALTFKNQETGEVIKEEYWHSMSILHKSLQIANGFYYTRPVNTEGKARGVPQLLNKMGAKSTALLSIINQYIAEGHRRIVVWYEYVYDFTLIHNVLANNNKIVMTDEARQLERFSKEPKNNEPPLIIVLPLACARGINDLITASIGIFFSNSFSQEVRDQAEKRLPRPGQKNKLVLHVDICCQEMADYNVVMALQSKSLTTEKLQAIAKLVTNGELREFNSEIVV